MKVLILHDLITDGTKVVVYDLKSDIKVFNIKKKGNEGRKIKKFNCLKKNWIRTMKEAAFFVFEFATSIFVGLAFLHIISKKLLEIRGYEALGGEVIAAVLVTVLAYELIERLGDMAWTKR